MKNAITRTLSPTQLAIRAAVMTSISLAVFLFAACDSNAPSGRGDQNPISGPQGLNKSHSNSASTFAVLGGTGDVTLTNSTVTGDVGHFPGTSDVIMTSSVVNGTVNANAKQAHIDFLAKYDAIAAMPCGTVLTGTLANDTLSPGVYCFDAAATLTGVLTLDGHGDANAVWIFKIGTSGTGALTGTDFSVVMANGGSPCNVYWWVAEAATMTTSNFQGTILAGAAVTVTGGTFNGDIMAKADVTLTDAVVGGCGSGGGPVPPPPCRDFVTGGGWIMASDGKATFGVSGGIKNGKSWGQLSYNNHSKYNGVKVKSTSVTAYTVIDAVTRQIDGIAKFNGKGPFSYTVVIVDKGEPGRNDSFSLQLSNGYSASGTLKGGNIQLHTKCGDSQDKNGEGDKESYDDKNERDGNNNYDND